MSVRLRLIIGIPLFGLMFFYLGLRISSRIILQEYSLRGWSAELRDGRAVIANVSANSVHEDLQGAAVNTQDYRSRRIVRPSGNACGRRVEWLPLWRLAALGQR